MTTTTATTTVFTTRKPTIIDRIKGYFLRRRIAQGVASRRKVFAEYLDEYYTNKKKAQL